MKANEKMLLRYIEGSDKNFIIPIYQRNYDWKKEQCKQLFDDILNIKKYNYKNHFIGSIVTIYHDDGKGQEYLIIDGQQRVTTISLLLLAIYNYINDNKIETNFNKDQIKEEYLVNKYSEGEKKIRLKPVKNDQSAYLKLFNSDVDDININSNITKNYQYFYDRLKTPNININDIFDSIKKLLIVDIELKRGEDDPQLIFESLNSTGLSLSQADLVRNFILMNQSNENQVSFYENYWNKIENNTHYRVSDFIRDYLTMKVRKVPNKDKVYMFFKKFILTNYKKDEIELALQELLKYSKYYFKIIDAKHNNKKINKYLVNINKLDVTVTYPFLLEVLDDLEIKKIITETDVINILVVLESYVFRRIICDVPTNALNKIFMTLARDIKRFPDFKENYVGILKYILSQKKGSQRFPDNEEFSEKFIYKDIYNMNAKNKLHLLENLENYNNKEKIDLDSLLEENEITIEHIMPKKITNIWRDALGKNADIIHDKYLNTIGNISFTAYNSEMSNKSFKEKKEMQGGFMQSKLSLNQYLKEINYWNEEHIIIRAKKLRDIALNTWLYPENKYEAKKDLENTYSLADDYNFTGQKIKSFVFLDQEQKVKSWRDFYHQVNLMLYDLSPNKYKDFFDDDDFKKNTRIMINNSKNSLNVPILITDGIFLESHMPTSAIINMTRMILKKCDLSEEDLNVCLKESVEQ